MKSITGSLTLAAFMSLFLVGCTSSPPSSNPTEAALEKPPKVGQPESAVISKEDFEKIPKNLRPEDLEQRDDTTVVIRPGNNETIREYRINGFLYGIQVIPKVGKPYYLVAADHMGNFTDPSRPGMLIPSWTIFQWK
ncbi:MAG: DUF2782 domain-containing protein [Endozoicomonas sp.]|uniref:DUF2782 domain-containing protein n=1 Tax=Endozoicomonas sp. TaxID=1892382 RepID=UPI003D9AD799